MKDFDPLGSYFALTLGVSRGGQLFCSMQTHWVGWSERNPRWEIRAASLVDPRLITKMWDSIGRGWVSVHDDASLSVYARLGGNALVELVREETHSCYLGERTWRHPWGYGCGDCPACGLRRAGWEAFSAGANAAP